mgnify:CR=1 FL=1
MKILKKLSVVLLLTMFLYLLPSMISSGEIYYGPTGDGAVITCSAGNYGRCYNEISNLCTYYNLISMECDWTGYQSDYCSLFIVKLYNICIDLIF